MNGEIYYRMRCQFCDKWAACRETKKGWVCIPCEREIALDDLRDMPFTHHEFEEGKEKNERR